MSYSIEQVKEIAAEAAAQAVRAYSAENAERAANKAADKTQWDYQQLREVMVATVGETLTALGIEHDDPIEVQKDMRHLREWRTSTENIKQKGYLTMVAISVSGTLGLVVLGLKKWLNGE
jgi:arginyl-tRNA synthetase